MTFANVIELLIVIALCGFVISFFFPWPSIMQFGQMSLMLLLLWRYALRKRSGRAIPLPVVILSILFFLSLVLSAVISQNKDYFFFEYKAFKYFLVGGLLVTSALSEPYRKIVIIVLFASAAIDSLAGMLQYIGPIRPAYGRLNGYAVISTLYAAKLAFIAGISTLLLIYRERTLFRSLWGTIFLVVTAMMTWGGILLSGSRGTWLALPAGLLIILSIYNPKKALIVFFILITVMTATFSLDKNLWSRMVSLVQTQAYEDAKGSFGNRVELLKGAFILFKSSPFLGVGSGDFQQEITTLVRDRHLREIPTTIHAHNVFVHILATQGIIGLSLFAGLCAALLLWGMQLLRLYQGINGHIVLFCTLVVMLSGLSDYYFASPHYALLWCISIGLFASIGSPVEQIDACK